MKYKIIPLKARPRNGRKHRTHFSYFLESRMIRFALSIALMGVFSACSRAPSYPMYTGGGDSIASTGVGTGDIHALDGNLVW